MVVRGAVEAPVGHAGPEGIDSSVGGSPTTSLADTLPTDPAGGGEMAALMRSVDWSATALGPVDAWPQSLRTSLSICLGTSFPMMIAWGPELHMLYNDAYLPVLGSRKHPQALGQPLLECFAEIRDLLGEMFGGVMRTGVAVGATDMMFPIERHGFPEETYFVFSYSPIHDESGRVGGVLTTCTETTDRVIGARRLGLLRELAEATSGSVSPADAGARLVACLARSSPDVPFSLLYLGDPQAETFELAGASGIASPSELAPAIINVAGDGGPWPVREVLHERASRVVEGLALDNLPGNPWPEPVTRALVLPVGPSGLEGPAGILVAGLSPRLPLDDGYRDFLRLVAGHAGSAVADARAFEDEKRRAESLAELDRAKSAFFSDVSHEFRTPLTLLLGPLESVLDGPNALEPPVREALVIARRNGHRLQKLVNTMLDFSRIEAGRMEAALEPTDLAELTAGLASTFRSATEQAGLELSVDCPPLPDPVPVDPEMWEKIVLNLVSNAFKFTFEGRISVRLSLAGDDVELEVSDTGVGIPREEQQRVFERFHRVRGARARTHEGSGIGLALVRELVSLHRGTIELTSEVGRGTAFRVRIPRRASVRTLLSASGRPASTPDAASAFVEEALRWLPDGPPEGDGLDAMAATSTRAISGPTRGARILVVDDNADMRDYLRRVFEAVGWIVDVAPDGRAALERIRLAIPDLVVADVMMPAVDGLELARRLRSEPAGADVPIVLLSARAGEEARLDGLDSGADDYLVKPFSARELVSRVAAQLQLAAHRRTLAAQASELRAVIDAISDGVVLVDDLGGVVLRNTAADRIVGRPIERFADLVEGLELRDGQDLLSAALANPLEVRVESGEERWAHLQAHPVPHPDAPGAASIGAVLLLRDITAERQARTLRDAFIGVISHELRTPITTIYAGSKLLARGGGADPADIEAEAERLFRLVEDLLALARFERGAVDYVDEPVLIQRVMPFVLRSEEARWPTVRFVLELSEDLPAVRADPTFVEQIARNLLENAAKYGDGGRVTLRATTEGEDVVVRIRDEGRGIAPDDADRVFELFYRSQSAVGKPGAGIGLFVARRLTELMGGRIWARPLEPHGSEFGFALAKYQIDEDLRAHGDESA